MKLRYPQACIAVFSREPVAGKVKTRLIPALGAEGACAVHKHLLTRQFAALQTSNLCHFQLWVDHNPQHSLFSDFNGEVKLQQTGDLGEKMQQTMATILVDYDYALIIGSDCPLIDEAYLEQAIIALNSGNEVVLGPAEDGGYVLIGLATLIPELFQQITWGQSQVLEQTRTKLHDKNIQWAELTTLYDIDRPEDLKRLTDFHFSSNNI